MNGGSANQGKPAVPFVGYRPKAPEQPAVKPGALALSAGKLAGVGRDECSDDDGNGDDDGSGDGSESESDGSWVDDGGSEDEGDEDGNPRRRSKKGGKGGPTAGGRGGIGRGPAAGLASSHLARRPGLLSARPQVIGKLKPIDEASPASKGAGPSGAADNNKEKENAAQRKAAQGFKRPKPTLGGGLAKVHARLTRARARVCACAVAIPFACRCDSLLPHARSLLPHERSLLAIPPAIPPANARHRLTLARPLRSPTSLPPPPLRVSKAKPVASAGAGSSHAPLPPAGARAAAPIPPPQKKRTIAADDEDQGEDESDDVEDELSADDGEGDNGVPQRQKEQVMQVATTRSPRRFEALVAFSRQPQPPSQALHPTLTRASVCSCLCPCSCFRR